MCACHYFSLFHHNFIMFRCQRPRYAYRRFFGSIFAVVHRYGSWHDENVRDPKMLHESPEVSKSMCTPKRSKFLIPRRQKHSVQNVQKVHRLGPQRLNGTPIDYLTWGNHEAWAAQCAQMDFLVTLPLLKYLSLSDYESASVRREKKYR